MLIGMPSVGKSTAGVLVAKRLGFGYLDGDLLIRREEGALLSEIIEARGVDAFIEIEERVNLGIDTFHCVVSTGGSAVYSEAAMRHLQQIGMVVYLKIGADEVKRRIPSLAKRGVVMRGSVSSVEELYAERAPLYEKYASVTVECDGKSIDEIVNEIVSLTED